MKTKVVLVVSLIVVLCLASCGVKTEDLESVKSDVAGLRQENSQLSQEVSDISDDIGVLTIIMMTKDGSQTTSTTGVSTGGSSTGKTSEGAGKTFGTDDPQPYVPHPSLYVETGTKGKTTWLIDIPADSILVVGGLEVDGVGGGVYRAYSGGQEVTVTVKDGFASVVISEWGRNEFCFRLGQAVEYDWKHNTVQPLPEWESCN